MPSPSTAMSESPSAPSFAIVTALPEEFSAVLTVLDSPQDLPPVGEDGIQYVVGTLPSATAGQPHVIVLVQILDPGNATAAAAVTNLVRSFPTVSYVVMVGIAAGVPNLSEPSKHVRLGDIVVARCGVVDYDHVDQTTDGVRLRSGVGRPSPFLAAAADRLRAGELRGQRPWEQWLGTDADRPDRAAYHRPADDTDILYATDGSDTRLAHADGAETGHRPAHPKVHLGLIGSANRSLSNASVRDTLAAQYDLRAFEMEASGVGTSSFINGREWFVVRGISDYADERRDGLWRNYAALAAAAYVRALLAECRPVKPIHPGPGQRVGMPWPDRGVGERVAVIALVSTLVVATVVALVAFSSQPPSPGGTASCSGRTVIHIPDDAQVASRTSVKVDAEHGLKTDVAVQAGDFMELTATGSWFNGVSGTDADGDCTRGAQACGQCPVPEGNLGELIGVLSEPTQQSRFRVGTHNIVTADRNGRLEFAMNDNLGDCGGQSCYRGNNGTLTVQIVVWRPGPQRPAGHVVPPTTTGA